MLAAAVFADTSCNNGDAALLKQHRLMRFASTWHPADKGYQDAWNRHLCGLHLQALLHASHEVDYNEWDTFGQRNRSLNCQILLYSWTSATEKQDLEGLRNLTQRSRHQIRNRAAQYCNMYTLVHASHPRQRKGQLCQPYLQTYAEHLNKNIHIKRQACLLRSKNGFCKRNHDAQTCKAWHSPRTTFDC